MNQGVVLMSEENNYMGIDCFIHL